ncbi:MAG: hypothetical protein HQK52_23525 [Oligoflexia bacterium]|nr:hypothetical protein [Oligoflexia bacterium]
MPLSTADIGQMVEGYEQLHNNLVIISTTSSSDLKKLVDEGKFSEELYYELSSISFSIKPLQERREDLFLLIKHFTEQYSQSTGVAYPELPQVILDLLLNYSWPGNISELQSVLEKLFVLGYEDGEYNINELPEKLLSKNYDLLSTGANNTIATLNEIIEGNRSYKEKIIMCKRLVIESAIKKGGNMVAQAASLLQRNRCSLYREMNELKIKVP